jgi:hypothetical protein
MRRLQSHGHFEARAAERVEEPIDPCADERGMRLDDHLLDLPSAPIAP